MHDNEPQLTAELLLQAYANGYFPMGQTRDDEALHWFHPEQRGIIPLHHFHVPKSLAKAVRKNPFTLTTNQAFPDVIRACSQTSPTRDESWINEPIIALFTELWHKGFAHSVETWENTTLIGGLYGVSLGGAFFGESMFSRKTNASKIALVHLVQLLTKAGYQLLDTQYTNDHLTQFGVMEITRDDYLLRLDSALEIRPQPCFSRPPAPQP